LFFLLILGHDHCTFLYQRATAQLTAFFKSVYQHCSLVLNILIRIIICQGYGFSYSQEDVYTGINFIFKMFQNYRKDSGGFELSNESFIFLASKYQEMYQFQEDVYTGINFIFKCCKKLSNRQWRFRTVERILHIFGF
jgi:hypothetical protein